MTGISKEIMKIKVYIINHIFKRGIVEVEGWIDSEDPLQFLVQRSNGSFTYYKDKEWYCTFAEAIIYAEKLRTSRLVYLRKQIIKLENLKFSLPS